MRNEGRGQRAEGGGVARIALTAFVVGITLLQTACARGGGNAADSAAPSAVGDTTAVSAPPDTARQPTGRDTPPASSSADTSRALRPPADRAPSTQPPARRPPAASSDTARGIVAVVGAIPITEVVLRPAGGQQITLTGALAREIGVASGADVWVRGRRVDARTMDVVAYAVRSVDGVTAITGTLTADGDRLVLVTDDGRRHPIARPPEPLRQLVGARVWITGDPSTAISTYGILRRAR
jgi:hypothetical protein